MTTDIQKVKRAEVEVQQIWLYDPWGNDYDRPTWERVYPPADADRAADAFEAYCDGERAGDE